MTDKQIIPNHDTLCYYFYFIQERMNIFWEKCEENNNGMYTKDEILRTYKFTNVYRACDRVSQYLIKNIIYKDVEKCRAEDLLLRILIFKVFNKIETWEYLCENFKEGITIQTFNANEISKILTLRKQTNPIFSNAYMMTGSHKKYDAFSSKHEKWLTMIKEEFINKNIFTKILNANSLEQVYNILNECSFIGNFLAYQYAIDFNYCPYLNYDENSFVKAGVGAIRGIKKCFINYGNTYEDAIYYVQNNFTELQRQYGYTNFKALPNHEPSLIDLQNCFCETDKYLRAKMPDLKIDNVRIKQKYKESSLPIHFYFPPNWNIKSDKLCTKPNLKGLTLF